MSRDTTTTKRDRDFMRLRDEILKVIRIAYVGDKRGKIKARKDWRDFKNYMNTYYE